MRLFLLLLLLSNVAFSAVISTEGKNGNIPYYKYRLGSLYLLVEILDNHLLHFEYRMAGEPEGQFPDQTRIQVSPMVERREYPGPTGDKNVFFDVDKDLCLLVYDQGKQRFLTTMCPIDLHKGDGKGLNLNPAATKHAYGLGQHFRNPGEADGDWVGSVFEPGHFGNAMRSFANGAPIVNQFPVLYGLGDGKLTYALFLDNVYQQRWDLSKFWWEWRTNGGNEIRGFVLTGNDLPEVRRRYMDLVGRAPVPPKNLFGYWVSEFGFESFAEMDAVLKGGRLPWGEWRRKWNPNEGWVWREYQEAGSRGLFEDGFPVDGMACDLQWYGGEFGGNPDFGNMGRLEFDHDNFPNASAKVRDLRENDGVDLMLIEQSYVGNSQFPGQKALFDLMAEKQFLVKQANGWPAWLTPGAPWFWVGGMIDWTNGAAAKFWHDHKRVALIKMGIRKHWTDLGEPEIFSGEGKYAGVEPGRHNHNDVHNVYNLKWAEGISQGYKGTHPNERFYSMARAGTSGIQRHGAGMWSGDIAANRASFVGHVNARMHMSLAGVDYYSSDIGGFHRRPETIDHENAFPELYTQWLATGSLIDIPVRTHVWNLDNSKPSAANRAGDVASNRDNIRTRYELTPYYYSLAHRAARTGDPVLPPLVYHYQDDANVRKIANQVLIGRDLMMGIVASYGETERNVYLPAGRWADYRNAEWMDSHGQAAVGIPVYRRGKLVPPLFARAGAILPKMWVDEKTRNTLGKRSDGSVLNELRLQVFADGQESRFTLYEDDRVKKNTGVRTTEIVQRQENDRAWVRIEGSKGNYPEAPSARENELELVVDGWRAKGFKVYMDGHSIQECFGGDCLGNVAKNRIRVRTAGLPVSKEKTIEVFLERTESRVSIPFHCFDGKTNLGEAVYISGSLPELGEFDPKRAVRLDKVPFHWTWTGLVENLPKDRDFEWKCVKLREHDRAELQWESGPNHRAHTSTNYRHGYAKVTGRL